MFTTPRNRTIITAALLAAPGVCSFTLAAEPVAVDAGALRGVLHGDARVLWLGDSYCLPYASRVSGGSLLSWRADAWTAFTMGDGPSWFHVYYTELDPGLNKIDTSNSYRLFETGPDATVQYALPVWRLREHYRDPADLGPAPLIEYGIRPNRLEPGFFGRFADAGETVRIRPLLLDPPGAPVSVAAVGYESADATASIAFDPRTQSRPKRLAGFDPEIDGPVAPADGHVFAAPAELDVTASGNARVEFTLTDTSADGGSGYLLPAGFVASRLAGGQRPPGLYFSVLTDGSWAYESFGLDTPSGTPGTPTKTYSVEQMAHWLDATTLDPAQPIYAFYLVNVEDIEPATAAAQMEAMVDQTNAGVALAGITGEVRHCIVIPWMHRIEGEDLLGRHEEQRDAAFALASARADVSAVSIFDFTDGHVFDGNAASRQWLADHGYDAFTYGDRTVDLSADGGGVGGGLLDIFKSHPEGQDAGAFFSHVIERVIIDACPADFAAPYGVLDLGDIGGFITRFIEQRPSADLAAPTGAFDLADLSAFVASFTAGCGQ